jgi:hypothetical protein
MESEVLFTEAALGADPDAEDLKKVTESWLSMIDAVRAKEREVRRLVAQTDAARISADGRLDEACTRFGAELGFVVGREKDSPRLKQFFDLPVSRFVRTSLVRQIARVRSWLGSQDEVFLRHKGAIEQWVERADKALVASRGLSLPRAEAQMARQELAEDLTRERDGLEEALRARGREKSLSREWAKGFFRSGERGGREGSSEEAESEAESSSSEE